MHQAACAAESRGQVLCCFGACAGRNVRARIEPCREFRGALRFAIDQEDVLRAKAHQRIGNRCTGASAAEQDNAR